MADSVVVFAGDIDADVAYVIKALSILNFDVALVDGSTILGSGALSVYSGSHSRVAMVEANGRSYSLDDQQVSVWNRRNFYSPQDPGFNSPAEFEEARTNLFHATACLKSLLNGRNATNTWLANERYSVKTEQYQLAAQSGFCVPATLISNNPARIREFARSLSRVCVKPFASTNFNQGKPGANARVFTATILERLDEIDDSPLAAAPLIYQQMIEKTCDVRIAAFGDHASGVMIPFDKNDDPLDYKSSFNYLSKLRPVALPDNIRSMVKSYLRQAGLGFAVFDFAVSETGDWWFLEANTAGRFTWMELFCEDVNLLWPFCFHLVGSDGNGHVAVADLPDMSFVVNEAEEDPAIAKFVGEPVVVASG
ncbi:MAG TPA: hypothetical protein VEZ20_03280 [Allosphingosinicella sp.]|jgi:hypothetical protein|nr:hypothetical protein [Allosphingosinicella sp.]